MSDVVVTSRRSSFPKKYVVQLALCAAVSLLAVGVLIHHQYRQTLEEWKNRLSSIAEGEELYVRTWVFEREGDLAVLSSRPLLATALLRQESIPQEGEIAEGSAKLQGAITQPLLDKVVGAYGYTAIYLVDRTGVVRASSKGAVALPPEILKEAKDCDQVTFKTLPETLPDGARMALLAPVRGGVTHGDFRPGAGELLGGLVVLTKAELIYALPSLGTTSTRTGESILIQREGDTAVFMSSLRHLDGISSERRRSLKPAAFSANTVLHGEFGFSSFIDYRGVSVLGASRVIPNVGWGLITKIDRKEALENFYFLAALEISATSIIFGVLVVIAFKSWRDQQVQSLRQEIIVREKAEAELRLSHERLALALKAGKSGTFEWNIKTGESFASPELGELYGVASGEAMGSYEVWEKLILPEDLPVAKTAIAQAFQTGEFVGEWRVRRASDGQICWISARAKVQFDDEKRPVRMIGVNADVTASKLIEQELRVSQEQFSSAFENAPIGIALASPSGQWIKINKALSDLVGYSNEELLEKTFQDITHPDDREADLEHVRRMIAREIHTYQVEKRYFHKSGNIVWISLSASLVRNEKGEPLHFIAQIKDITARKQAEEELHRINRALRTLSNCNHALVCATAEPQLLQDVFRVIVRDSGYQMAWVGFSGNDSEKMRVAVAQDYDGSFLQRLNTAWGEIEKGSGPTKTAMRTGQPAVCRNLSLNPDFTPLQAESIAQEYHSSLVLPLVSDGTLIGALTIYSSETEAFNAEELKLLAALGNNLSYGILALRRAEEKRRTDDALRETEAKLNESQKMEALGHLAGGIAHDFNNLLGIIIGYSELLVEALSVDPTFSKRIGAIKKSAERAASMTSQLLAFSRKQLLRPKVLNLNSLVADTEALLHRLIGEDIDMHASLDAALGQIKADPGQMVQIIINLVVNARDAMPEGGKLTLETRTAILGEGLTCLGLPVRPGSYVMLAVADTGTGMDEATKIRIFEPFFTTKPAGKGTGLGLATVFGIVQQSRGYIFVETEFGKGTTFKIYLPAVQEDVEEVAMQTAPLPTHRAFETILVVEDEESFRDLLTEHLKANGYTALPASNGVEALRVAQEHSDDIHLVITDVIMPQMSGPALVRSLRALRPQVNVLYMSGYTDDKLNDSMSEDGIALLQKPFSLSDFVLTVRSVLHRTEAAAAG